MSADWHDIVQEVTEMNSLRLSDANLCMIWQRQRERLQFAALLLCAIVVIFVPLYLIKLRERTALPTFKSRSKSRRLHTS